jgi:MFS family permease
MYFAGAIISTLVITRIGDLYGRKLPTLISSLVSLPIHLGLILSRSLNLSIALFFLLGLTRPGKMQVSFVYLSELVPEAHRRRVGSFILFFDGGSLILFALYFKYISKQWVYFQLYALGISAISALVLFAIPESPKYLMEKDRYDDARKSLVSIATFNNVSMTARDILRNSEFKEK